MLRGVLGVLTGILARVCLWAQWGLDLSMPDGLQKLEDARPQWILVSVDTLEGREGSSR